MSSNQIPIPDSMKSFADPSKVGKGVWYLLYCMISEIKDSKDRDHINYAVEVIRKRFHCLKCRNHFNTYCNQHPLNQVLYSDDPKDIFNWLYNANMNANSHAGHGIQPIKDFETFFYEDVICDHDCGGPKSPQPSIQWPPKNTVSNITPYISVKKITSPIGSYTIPIINAAGSLQNKISTISTINTSSPQIPVYKPVIRSPTPVSYYNPTQQNNLDRRVSSPSLRLISPQYQQADISTPNISSYGRFGSPYK
jgi:hypothetical protein